VQITWNDYIDALRQEGERLAAAAATGMDAPVPWCPGWAGRDVVGHTGTVHRHKLEIVAGSLGHSPKPPPPPQSDGEILDWYREGLTALAGVLESADPGAAVWTWHPSDQTVGFWIRRMAHETAIHRADAESTAGPITPIPPRLAADGVDEVLGPIMCGYTTEPSWEFSADGRSAELRFADTGDVRCLLLGEGEFGPGWLYQVGPAPDPVAVITAPASDLHLWAWGRAEASVLDVEGDAAIAGMIRAVAAAATT